MVYISLLCKFTVHFIVCHVSFGMNRAIYSFTNWPLLGCALTSSYSLHSHLPYDRKKNAREVPLSHTVADPGENLTGAIHSNFGRGGRG